MYFMNYLFNKNTSPALREKCPNTEFFWSVFSCIPTKYRETRIRKNSVFGQFSCSPASSWIRKADEVVAVEVEVVTNACL